MPQTLKTLKPQQASLWGYTAQITVRLLQSTLQGSVISTQYSTWSSSCWITTHKCIWTPYCAKRCDYILADSFWKTLKPENHKPSFVMMISKRAAAAKVIKNTYDDLHGVGYFGGEMGIAVTIFFATLLPWLTISCCWFATQSWNTIMRHFFSLSHILQGKKTSLFL